MKSKASLRIQSAVFILVLFLILVLLNVLSVRFFARADLTRDGLFTLSRASVDLVKNVDDRLVVKAYFTKNLPGRYASLERHVGDLLEEYRTNSGGKMTVEFIDPEGDEDEEETAKTLGIRKMPNPDIEKDQATIKEGYRGVSFSYGQNTEVIRAVESAIGLEYQITSLLKKLLGRKTNVAFLVGHGEPMSEPPTEDGKPVPPGERLKRGAYRNVRSNLDIYNYRDVHLKDGSSGIPPEVAALVISRTTGKINDKELYLIDQFLMEGKSIAVFISPVQVGVVPGEYPGMPHTYETSVTETGLPEFLAHYGVEVGKELIYDRQASKFSAQCPPLPIPIPRAYPAWPLLSAFDDEHPVTFRLTNLTMPYAVRVGVADTAMDDDQMDAREIAFSSGNAWNAGGDGAIVDPCGILDPITMESNVPMIAALSGNFTSYFAGKELPSEKAKESFKDKSVKPGRLIVVGSGDVPQDQAILYLAKIDNRQAAANFTFVQNVLDWLTNEEDLIAVRMKTVADPALNKDLIKDVFVAKWGNILGIPLVLILFGVVRWRIRARGSKRRSAPVKTAGNAGAQTGSSHNEKS